jgi:hypothetical protein
MTAMNLKRQASTLRDRHGTCLASYLSRQFRASFAQPQPTSSKHHLVFLHHRDSVYYTVTMKFSQASLLAACLPAVSARFIETAEVNNVVLQPEELFLVETAPGKTQWVTEEDKWEMRRVSLISSLLILIYRPAC